MTDESVMHTGAFAMLDVLGFKGIWKRTPPATVLAKLRRMRTQADATTTRVAEHLRSAGDKLPPGSIGASAFTGLQHKTAFLSDTIVIGVWPSSESTGATVVALSALAIMVRRVQRVALRDDPQMLLRGVVTWGKFTMDDVFLVGPAIDEAAILEREADAAVVWFAPSASKQLTDGLATVVEEVTVPLKGGRRYTTFVVDMLGKFDTRDKEEVEIKRFQLAFGDYGASLEVELKMQNTVDILRSLMNERTNRTQVLSWAHALADDDE